MRAVRTQKGHKEVRYQDGHVFSREQLEELDPRIEDLGAGRKKLSLAEFERRLDATSFTDTNAVASARCFYRVRMED